MTSLLQLMPIIILLLIVGLIVFATFKLPKGNWRRSYTTRVRRLFIVYSAVLILAVPAALMLPESSDAPGEAVSAPVDDFPRLAGMAEDGSIDKTDQIYQQESWELSAEKQDIRLEMVSGHDPYTGIPVYAERVSDQSDTIQATYYQTPLIIEGRDMSDKLPPLDVQYTSGAIRINVSTPFDIDLSTFRQEFPISQFTSTSGEENGPWSDRVIKGGEQLIYLKIPEDVQLDALEGMPFHYVWPSAGP
ncbi:hypothetical protein GCM10028778_26610 [Barrientosiimonas marina]|uniref:Uncharacterized protein n=1 Tax=Lentibacillus kimchii TaxID=1542911 RepID=A0ABW2UU45_9BACI